MSEAELIIEHKQLRLSRISDMRNDPEEGEYVIRIFRDCLSELRDENSITAEDCKLLEGCILNLDCPHLYSSYGGQSKSQRVKTIPYVACFTLADNQHMWSEYSDGIALKFWMNESLLMREHKRDGPNYSSYFKIYKVQYDSPEFRKWMKEMIMGAKNPYNNDEWVEYVHELLVRSHIAVKDSKFKDEKEFRLVFFKPEGMKSDDPLCEHLCQTHVDLIGSEQVVNPFDPESDEYV